VERVAGCSPPSMSIPVRSSQNPFPRRPREATTRPTSAPSSTPSTALSTRPWPSASSWTTVPATSRNRPGPGSLPTPAGSCTTSHPTPTGSTRSSGSSRSCSARSSATASSPHAKTSSTSSSRSSPATTRPPARSMDLRRRPPSPAGWGCRPRAGRRPPTGRCQARTGYTRTSETCRPGPKSASSV
jgi:hypothetical protein